MVVRNSRSKTPVIRGRIKKNPSPIRAVSRTRRAADNQVSPSENSTSASSSTKQSKQNSHTKRASVDESELESKSESESKRSGRSKSPQNKSSSRNGSSGRGGLQNKKNRSNSKGKSGKSSDSIRQSTRKINTKSESKNRSISKSENKSPTKKSNSYESLSWLYLLCILALVAIILASWFYIIPVSLSMLVYSGSIIYIGSHASLSLLGLEDDLEDDLDKEGDGLEGSEEGDGLEGSEEGRRFRKGIEQMTMSNALFFPVMASCTLMTLYMVYKYASKDWVNYVLSYYMLGVGWLCAGTFVKLLIETVFLECYLITYCKKCSKRTAGKKETAHRLYNNWFLRIYVGRTIGSLIDKVVYCFAEDENAIQNTEDDHTIIEEQHSRKRETDTIEFRSGDLLSTFSGLGISIVFFWTNHFLLHNFLASTFAIQGLLFFSLNNFKIGMVLLVGLFIYDIFWVFGTDVMVAVAKSFDAPGKIIFPLSFDPWKQSILGLGDIAIPGFFIAMVLRWDCWRYYNNLDRDRAMENVSISSISKWRRYLSPHLNFPKFHFWVVLVFYEVGLLFSWWILKVYGVPQPALLYLVPAVIFGLFTACLAKGTIKEMWAYSEGDEGVVEGDTGKIEGHTLNVGSETKLVNDQNDEKTKGEMSTPKKKFVSSKNKSPTPTKIPSIKKKIQ